MSLPIDQVIAYMMTVVSVILFIIEKKKNSKAPVYMSLQGLLKSAYAKYKMHQSNYGLLLQSKMEQSERPVTIEEYLLYVQLISLDYEAQMENILGVMKSLEIKDDSIFNKNDFTGHEEILKEIRNRNHQAKNA
jgi:hypothetical protein